LAQNRTPKGTGQGCGRSLDEITAIDLHFKNGDYLQLHALKYPESSISTPKMRRENLPLSHRLMLSGVTNT
jgi:hypothetical protein